MRSLFLLAGCLLFGILDLNAQGRRIRFVSQEHLSFSLQANAPLFFGGGLQNPRIDQCDLDGDGLEDMIISEGFSERFAIYKADSNGLPINRLVDLESQLPAIRGFFDFADFDGDGDKDLIKGRGKLSVFEQDGTLNSFANFSLLHRNLMADGEAITFVDGEEPAFVDLNGDGLLDILVFGDDGARMRHYRALGGAEYELMESCWGRFEEGGLSADITIGLSCGSGKKSAGHPGSGLYAFDRDGDGDIDLTISDVTGNTASYLENGKADFNHPFDTIISVTRLFPNEEDQLKIPTFPSFSPLHLFGDSLPGLYSASGARSPIAAGLFWFYRQPTRGKFDLVSRNFLAEDQLDHGVHSIPLFFDYDGDGFQDLFVSYTKNLNDSFNRGQAVHIAVYRNLEGNGFKLIDEDFLNLSNEEATFFSPVFGEFDENPGIDLVLGTENGTLWLYNRKSNLEFELVRKNYLSIDVGSNARPCAYDFNGNGFSDLLLGAYDGEIRFLRNKGDGSFDIVEEKLGGIGTNTFFYQYKTNEQGEVIDSSKVVLPVGAAHPSIGDVNRNGQPDLICGSAWGYLYYYPDFDINDRASFIRAEKSFHNRSLLENENKDFGEYISPAFGDVNGDGRIELLLGSYLGGLELLTTDSVVVGLNDREKLKASVYPNPSSGGFTVELDELDRRFDWVVYDLNGRKIVEGQSRGRTHIQLEKRGVYFLRATHNNRRYTVKIFIPNK